jgi:hypothetical protein
LAQRYWDCPHDGACRCLTTEKAAYDKARASNVRRRDHEAARPALTDVQMQQLKQAASALPTLWRGPFCAVACRLATLPIRLTTTCQAATIAVWRPGIDTPMFCGKPEEANWPNIMMMMMMQSTSAAAATKWIMPPHDERRPI